MKKSLLILLTLLAAAAGGCTVFGEPFDAPTGELTIVGEVRNLCKDGRAFVFGQVRNTGPLEVRDISAVADLFGGSGQFLGTFAGPVTESVELLDIFLLDSDGEPVLDEQGQPIVLETIVIPIDTLDVEENGSFSVETSVGCGAVSRSEVSFDFTVGVFTDEEL